MSIWVRDCLRCVKSNEGPEFLGVAAHRRELRLTTGTRSSILRMRWQDLEFVGGSAGCGVVPPLWCLDCDRRENCSTEFDSCMMKLI